MDIGLDCIGIEGIVRAGVDMDGVDMDGLDMDGIVADPPPIPRPRPCANAPVTVRTTNPAVTIRYFITTSNYKRLDGSYSLTQIY